MILPKTFYARHGEDVAKDLLGKILVRKTGQEIEKLIITETECYHGFEDKASHGYKGRTPRSELMYATVGHTYIYLIYGMYWMLNITTFQEEFPSAVLIRGGYDIETKQNLNGPGKLTRFLDIDKKLNGQPVFNEDSILSVEDSPYVNLNIEISTRIGIDYAQESRELMWRFYIDPSQLN